MDGYVRRLQVRFSEKLLTASGITRKLDVLDATAIRQTAFFVSDFDVDYPALPDVLYIILFQTMHIGMQCHDIS
jgi:hypothetical protein